MPIPISLLLEKSQQPVGLESTKTPYGTDLTAATKALRMKFKWLPTAMRFSAFGGFMSPRGMFFANKAQNYENETLTRGYLWVPDDKVDRWALQDWALYQGWVRLDWWQSYGGTSTLNFSPHVVRRLTLTLYPGAGQLDRPEYMLRLLSMIRAYDDLFQEALVYEIACVNFLNLDDPDLPVSSFVETKRRIFSANAVDLYLQLLRQRRYNDALQFTD